MNLDIRLDPRLSGLCAGARLAGRVAAATGGDARRVEAWLELREQAAGRSHVARRTAPLRLHDGPVPPGHELRFVLRIPVGAQPSLTTPWGALAWALVVRAERPGAPDARAELELEIL